MKKTKQKHLIPHLSFLQTISLHPASINETIADIPLPIYPFTIKHGDSENEIEERRRARGVREDSERRARGRERERNEVESTLRKREEH